MKIFVNQKIKRLFLCVLSAAFLFTVLSLFLVCPGSGKSRLYIGAAGVLTLFLIAAFLYGYFREQNRLLQDAVTQIREYLAGNQDARIACDDEGELYRLFHEINSLMTILNAHAERERQAKVFLKDQLSDISHQLKTPLAALNIYNGLIQEETERLPELKTFADLSEQELDHMDSLIQSLLKLTRLESGTISLKKSWQNVSEIMEYLERPFSVQADRERKNLRLSGDQDTMLYCDPVWLTEALSNLIKNAFDHTEAGAEICITWRTFASIVQIVIKDNGSGIHPEDMPHIFKRFYRSRFSKDTQGIGIGLSLSKAIIEEHQGTIEADSTLGAGTTFTINFLDPTNL